MTINDVKTQVMGLSEEERVNKAAEYLAEFISDCDKMNAKMGQSLDFRGIVSLVLLAAVAADGDLGAEEYALYKVLCDTINATSKSYEECRGLLAGASEFIDGFEEMIPTIKNIMNSTGFGDSFDKLTFAVASLVIQDDDIDEEEVRLLLFFLDDDDDDGSVNASSSAKATVRTEDVKLVNYAASFTRDDDRYYFTIGAELKNPNVEHCARNVNVKVIVKDSAGRILETSQNTIDYIDSNATFYYGDEFSIDRGVPANYTVQVNCDDFVSAPANSTFSSGISCSHYNVSTNRWGNTEFTGNVHNGYKKKLWVELYFVFYNSAGKITGGTNTRTTLYGNSDDAFDIYLNTNVSRDKVRCSPTFNFMDLVD